MADKKKEKLEHIQVKDNGIKLSHKIGDTLGDSKQALQNEIINSLLKGRNETSLVRYRITQNNQLRDFKVKTNKLINQTKKTVNTAFKSDTTVNLTDKQIKTMTGQIDKGLLFLQQSAIQQYQNTIKSVVLKCKSAGDLKDQLQKHIESGVNVGVVYKDGKEFKFDNYWEMKTRTDIQQDIGKNMVDTGSALGVIFYIAAYFGDCAKDHVDYQGKIYVDKDWKSNAPKDRIDEIQNYIDSKNIKTVQEVMEAPAYFTTRPNCRHYFQYIDIDSVLGAKNKDDVNKLRNDLNLNFNGKYKPEKYKALQEQRLNERRIRYKKEEIQKQEQLLALNPGDKLIQSKILNGESMVRKYQANQRELIKQYNNLERQYSREKISNRVDFGTGIKPKQIKTDVEVKVQNRSNSTSEREDEINESATIEHSPIFAVDFNVIKSRKYNDKVLNMVGRNMEDKRNIYPAIKDMLRHRSGTNGEDLIVYNPKTKELYVADKSTKPSGVEPDAKAIELIKKDPQNTITIHNHPESLPPSILDLNALVERNQSVGYVATHDGRIYKYTKPKSKIGGQPLSNTIDKVRLMRYDDEEKERLEIIKRLADLYKFKFEEVLD